METKNTILRSILHASRPITLQMLCALAIKKNIEQYKVIHSGFDETFHTKLIFLVNYLNFRKGNFVLLRQRMNKNVNILPMT